MVLTDTHSMVTGQKQVTEERMSRYSVVMFIVVVGLWCELSSGDARAADLTGTYQQVDTLTSDTTSTSGFHGMVGAGLFNGQSIIVDSERKTALRPLFFLRYEDWAYLSLRGGGVWLLQSADRSLRLGLGVTVHSGYNPYHESDLAGMDRRRASIDAGVNASWRTSIVDVGLSYAHDVANASKGDTASIRVSHGFMVEPRLRLTPSIGARWESAKVVDYYYGVRPNEALLPDRPAYQGRETTNYIAGISADYRLTKEWSLLGDIRTTHFGSGITDSPVVARKESTWVFVGAGWHF